MMISGIRYEEESLSFSLFLSVLIFILFNFLSCSTPAPTPPSPNGGSSKILEITLTLDAPPKTKFQDQNGHTFYFYYIIALRFDEEAMAVNLETWDEIFKWGYSGFQRFHRIHQPDDAHPDPETQWSSAMLMQEGYVYDKTVKYRLNLPDPLISDPSYYNILALTKVSTTPITKVTEEFTYNVVDVSGTLDTPITVVLDTNENSYASLNDDVNDFSTPFPEIPEEEYRTLDITSIEIRVYKKNIF